MNKAFVILGPTSSGKTSLSLDLAKKYNGEIVSADSRQIYKYMDIGTGKVPISSKEQIERHDSLWKINGVNIWGYDLVKPSEFYSSYDYSFFALEKLKKIVNQDKNVFITGGTGFYIDMLTGRVKPSFVGPDFDLREELNKLSVEDLVSKIKLIDKTALKNIDIENPVRLIRVIEKLTAKKVNKTPLPYLKNTKFYFLGLTAPREFFYQKVDNWADSIWEAGLVKETENLIQMGYGNSQRLKGLVYKSAVDFINKKTNKYESVQRIKFDLHAYIRRQQTYFKKNQDIQWFDITAENSKENIYNFIEGK